MLYKTLAAHGVAFGPSYRILSDLYLSDNEAIARVKPQSLSTSERSLLTLLHPTLIDAGIQLLGLCGMKICGLCVPFSIHSSRLFTVEDQPKELWAHAQNNGNQWIEAARRHRYIIRRYRRTLGGNGKS